jgi:glycosyltransferase involved in cell wall biosynthesis
MTLGGNVVIRNGNELDFCWRESIASLLPVCDVVSVSDGESTDGTQEEIRQWMAREPKLVLNVYPWPDPVGDSDWFVKWINYNREHVAADWQFQLDGDEVLHEKSYQEIRNFIETPNRTGVVTRYNFWKDHRHTIPDGHCLGKRVVRLAPQRLWLASDGEHPKGAEAASLGAPTGIEIYHYGFIRHRDRFFKKERLLQGYFFNSYDARLEAAEKSQGNWMENPGVTGWEGSLDGFEGTHPASALSWLKERGYD